MSYDDEWQRAREIVTVELLTPTKGNDKGRRLLLISQDTSELYRGYVPRNVSLREVMKAAASTIVAVANLEAG